MKYLILTQASVQYAELISQAMWSAQYPDSIRQGNETTSLYCGHISHPQSGDIALVFPSEVIPVHPLRNLQPLLDVILIPLQDEEARQVVTNHILNFDFENVPSTIENLLPPIYADNLKEEQFMNDNGWFNSGE